MRRIEVAVMGVCLLALMGSAGADQDQRAVLASTGNAFAEIAEQALPAVVFIDVESTIEVRQPVYRHPLEEFFGGGRYYGYGMPGAPETREYHQQGQGSGFIISKDGYILTNNHVVQDADRITVTLGDGRQFEAGLVGTDPKSEVGLIKIDGAENLPVIRMGDSDKLRVGEWVIAAGNPFGLSQTVTAGIVSGRDRRTGMLGEDGYENFIQTDAAINPGNSGGPLINIDGEVIGINTAIYSRTGGYMGIGFAIPINQAVQIKDQLIEHGKVLRSVLGIYIQEVDQDLADSFGIGTSGGILISRIIEDSAAEAAGLQEGDILMEIDGRPVGKVSAFRNRVSSTPPGTAVQLKIFRDGAYRTVEAVTRELEGEGSVAAADTAGAEMNDRLGLTVGELDAGMAAQLGIETGRGVLITEVEQGGAAWRAGLKPGQVISGVNRRAVGSISDYRKALEATAVGGKVLLLVTDGRSSRFVVLAVE